MSKKAKRGGKKDGDMTFVDYFSDFELDKSAPVHLFTGKIHAAELAAEDWHDTSTGPVSEKLPKLSGKLIVALIALCVALIALFQLVPYIVSSRYPEFTAKYELERYSDVKENLAILEDLGVDMTVAGTGGEALSFTIEDVFRPLATRKSYPFFGRSANTQVITVGDEITGDFHNYSPEDGWTNPRRYTVMTINGRDYQGFMYEDDLTELYLMALRQNDRQEAFSEDAGETLSSAAAKRALASTDRQAYEMSIYRPAAYPYNPALLKSRMNTASVAAPIAILVVLAIVRLIKRKRQKDEYLKKWNEESRQRWVERGM